MSGKTWSEHHVARAHRLGIDDQDLQNQQNGQGRRENPMIVRFTRRQDKMDILADGREDLRKQNIKVSGDLTKMPRSVIEDHRQRGFMLTTVAASWLSLDPYALHPAPMSATQTHAGVTGMAAICSEVKTPFIGTGTNCSSNMGPTPLTTITGKLPIMSAAADTNVTHNKTNKAIKTTQHVLTCVAVKTTRYVREATGQARTLTVSTGCTCQSTHCTKDNVTVTGQGSNVDNDSMEVQDTSTTQDMADTD